MRIPFIIAMILLIAVQAMAVETESEPTVWAFYTKASTYTNTGVGVDYIMWMQSDQQAKDGSPWKTGIGLFGTYEKGKVDGSSYKWKNYFIGPQVGLQYNGVNEDEQAYQLQGKLRLGYEKMEGRNSQGYHMTQKNLKVGAYLEYIKQTGEKGDAIVGGTLEGWYALSKSINSSWSGDKPSDRTQLGASVFYQKKFSPDWAWRIGAGPFTDMHNVGLSAYAQLRYKETIICGPSISIFDGVTSWTGICQIQGGHVIRKWDAEKRAARVEEKKKNGEVKAAQASFTKPAEGATIAPSVPSKSTTTVTVKEDGRYKTVYNPKYPNIKPKKFDTDPVWYKDLK